MRKWFVDLVWNNKIYILGAGLAIGIGFGAYHLINKVETLAEILR